MPNKIVNLVISVLIIGSFALSACEFTAQVPTINVDSTEVKPGETLVVSEMTATVEPTKVIEPIMRFSEAELPVEFVLGLEKLTQAIPAWESKTSDELEFEHLVFTKADDSYQETSILLTVENLTYILARSTNKIVTIEEILADTEIKPFLVMTKEDGQLAYFTQNVKDTGEIENQILMESVIRDGKSVTVAHLLDGTKVESTVEMGKLESAGRLEAAMVQPDYFKGEISVNPQTGELTATNITGEVVVWDGEAREWQSKSEKNQAFMDALEAKLTEEYGPSVVNAESPVQSYIIEGPDGKEMEVEGQRVGLFIGAVTPELKQMDLLSEYGYFNGYESMPNKKAGEVLRFVGNEEQAEYLKYVGAFIHLFAANKLEDSAFNQYFDPQWEINDEVKAAVDSEYKRFHDWAESLPDMKYAYECVRHVYEDGSKGYIKDTVTGHVAANLPIIVIDDIPWANVEGKDDSEKEKNSGSVVMETFRMAANIWVTSKGELIIKKHHLEVKDYSPYLYLHPGETAAIVRNFIAGGSKQFTNFIRLVASFDFNAFQYSQP